MNFLELAKRRYSCRKFSDKKVESELIDQVIEAALAAPTAINTQCFKIWVMQSEQSIENIRTISHFTFGAPHFFVLGSLKGGSWTRPEDDHNFAEVDAAIVGTHMMLELSDLGLDSTWVGDFNAPKLKEMYPQMKDYELIALIPFGYAAPDAHPSKLHTDSKTKQDVTEIL